MQIMRECAHCRSVEGITLYYMRLVARAHRYLCYIFLCQSCSGTYRERREVKTLVSVK